MDKRTSVTADEEAEYYAIEPGWKSYLYQLQLRAPQPKPVVCTRKEEDQPYFYDNEYHGSISRAEAEQLVSGEDGLYLTRKSQNKPGTYALTFSFGGIARNFRLYYDHSENSHYVAEKRFESVYDLVADGLITMYMDANAKDYIDDMAIKVLEDGKVSQNVATEKRQSLEVTSNQNDQIEGRQKLDSVSKRKSIKPSELEKHHNFKIHNFYGPHWCDHCKNFMWGLKAQGVKCQDCGYNAHKQCSDRIPARCAPDKRLVKRVFGVDLTTVVKVYNSKRPAVVDTCISEVESRGLTQEGIYRISGFADDVENLKNTIDKDGSVPDLSEKSFSDIHVISGVLKLYFRSLPIPLITFETYGIFISASKITDNVERIRAFHSALMKLPAAHYETLKFLMRHLQGVTRCQAINRMTSHNLGVVFGPTLLRAPDSEAMAAIADLPNQRLVAEILINEQDILFDN
ncbi:N-chimaerin-like [Rhopilema esculentum]|uniref:N-chimaerin-like n=1 Tax=Rhopilema esculentum TaxID=499914 RepID=UPI0031D53C3C|eukprot:gene14425-5481_t